MEHHIWRYAWDVFNNWAGYFTGGGIMAVITFWHSWREKPMRKKFLIVITVLFFVMGAYKAWYEQYNRAEMAEKHSDQYLHQSRDSLYTISNQRQSIDSLTVALLNRTNSDSSIEQQNNYKTPINVSNNSGNTSILIDSQNTIINQITNPLPKPYFWKTNVVSINVPVSIGYTGSIYETTIELEIACNKLSKYFLDFVPPPSAIGSSEMRIIENRAVYGLIDADLIRVVQIKFLTTTEISVSDMRFTIADAALK